MRLVPKIVAAVSIVILIGMIVLGSLSYIHSKNLILRQATDMQNLEMDFVSQSYTEQLNSIKRTAEIVSKNRSIRRSLDTGVSRGINQRLNEIVKIYPHFTYALVVDNEYEIFAVSTKNSKTDINRKENLLGEKIILSTNVKVDENKVVVGIPQTDKYSQTSDGKEKLTQWFYAPVKSGPNVIGWIILSYDWENETTAFLQKTKKGLLSQDSPIVDLTIHDGKIIWSSSNKQLSSLETSPSWMINERPMNIGGKILHLAIIVDKKMALKGILEEGQFILFITIPSILILVLVLGITLKKVLIQRIETLTSGHLQLTQGELSTRLPELGSDEIGELAKSFNDLAAWLSHATVSKDFVNDIIESTADGLITINSKSEIQLFNPAAEKMFGYSAEEIRGKPVELLMRDEERTQHQKYVKQSEIHIPRIINKSRELWGLRKDNQIFPMELTVSRLSSKKENIFVGVFRDVSERKEAERNLKKLADEQLELRRQAEQGEKSKSEFLATMSHEIRTPISGILGMAEALLEAELSSDDQRKVEVVYDSGHALMRLLNDILDLSKLEVGKLEIEEIDFSIDDEIVQVFDILKPKIEKKEITLSKTISPELPDAIKSDPTRFRQILYNLIGNAIKFTEEGSITVDISMQKNQLKVQVKDTGVGIDKDAQESLFARFQQVDTSTARKYGGSGLGLAICKSLIEVMGGEIGLKSEVGLGSVFWFTLKYKPASPNFKRRNIQKRINKFKSTRGLKILVVDDSPVIQKVIGEILTSLKHNVTFADDGRKAIEMNENNNFDLIIMDRRMPSLDEWKRREFSEKMAIRIYL